MQPSPNISVELSGSVAILRRPIRSDTGNKAPLLIAGFSVKNITQTSTASNALNTLFVTLSTNIDWAPSVLQAGNIVIVLSGLKETQTADSLDFPITEIPASPLQLPRLSQLADWTQASGSLKLHLLPNATIIAQHMLAFSFSIVNPSRAHSSAPVSVWAGRAAVGNTTLIEIESMPIQSTPGDAFLASQAEMQRAAGNKALFTSLPLSLPPSRPPSYLFQSMRSNVLE